MNYSLHLKHESLEQNSMSSANGDKALRGKLEALHEEYIKILPIPLQSTEGRTHYGVFFSVGNEAAKARVLFGCGPSAEEAWQDAAEKVRMHLEKCPQEIQYFKLDVPNAVEKTTLEDVNDQLGKTKMSFWRKGLAFDPYFQTAFLEQELNANKLILYGPNGISLQNINAYLLTQNRKQLYYLPDFVYTFQCISFFCDEKDKIYALYEDGLSYGRRRLSCVDDLLAKEVLRTAGEKLAATVGAEGKFVYGYRAVFHEAIPAYNILRHLSATWALLQEYDRSRSFPILRAVDRAVSFVLNSSVEFFENKAFVVERFADEVKLGGCALFAAVLESYIRLTDKKEYLTLAKQVGDGILFFAHPENGEFWHVLAFPGFVYKEKMRVTDYHSQGAFALARLYGLTGEIRYLEGAKSIGDSMICLNYAQYGDPWVAYAMNALTTYCTEERYFILAMENVAVNLPRIYEQKTSFHIYLELLMASFEIYDKMKEEFSSSSVLEKIDARWFLITIYYRAHHQLNGYMYPEYMMYFEKPGPYLYSFVVRHDGFRMRIDDVGHFMSGYYHFWKSYEKLERHRIRMGITPKDYMTFQEKYLHKEPFALSERVDINLPKKNRDGGEPHGQG